MWPFHVSGIFVMIVICVAISISCNCLGVAGGWTPAVHLYTQSGSKLKFDEEKQIFLPNQNTISI